MFFMNSIVIYVPKLTNRHKYVFQIIFNEIYKSNYFTTEDIEEYQSIQGVKINYSKNRITEDEIFVESEGLLSKRDINELDLKVFKKDNTKYLFRIDSETSYFHDVLFHLLVLKACTL